MSRKWSLHRRFWFYCPIPVRFYKMHNIFTISEHHIQCVHICPCKKCHMFVVLSYHGGRFSTMFIPSELCASKVKQRWRRMTAQWRQKIKVHCRRSEEVMGCLAKASFVLSSLESEKTQWTWSNEERTKREEWKGEDLKLSFVNCGKELLLQPWDF